MDKGQLFLSQIYVNPAPILKRLHARAKGKSAKIEKKICHITVYIEKKHI